MGHFAEVNYKGSLCTGAVLCSLTGPLSVTWDELNSSKTSAANKPGSFAVSKSKTLACYTYTVNTWQFTVKLSKLEIMHRRIFTSIQFLYINIVPVHRRTQKSKMQFLLQPGLAVTMHIINNRPTIQYLLCVEFCFSAGDDDGFVMWYNDLV